MAKDSSHRGIALAAIACAVLLFAGTYLHPMQADPNNAVAAFEEYAADRHWIAAHLLQFAGAASIVAALVLLGRVLAGGPAATVAALAGAGAVAARACAAAL